MAKKYDPWSEKVTVRLPKAPRGAEEFKFVGVNGRYFQIPLGKDTPVPRPVYDLLCDCLFAQEEADRYIDGITAR